MLIKFAHRTDEHPNGTDTTHPRRPVIVSGFAGAATGTHETDVMILLSRLNGTELGLNPDLIERVETTPDTVITLIDGTKYVIAEASTEVVARIIEFRARIIAKADEFAGHVPHQPISLQLVTDMAVGHDVTPLTADRRTSTGEEV